MKYDFIEMDKLNDNGNQPNEKLIKMSKIDRNTVD